MKREQVINSVKVKLDEFSQFDKTSPLIAESNNKNITPIESYIDENLDKAFDDIKVILPLHVFSDDRLLIDAASVSLTISDDNVGSLMLSDNYLRLHTIKLKSWKRPINIAMPMESPEYAQQLNPYTRGGLVKPVVVKDGNSLLLYSTSSNDTSANAVTIFKYLGVTPSGYLYFPDRLVEAIVLRCAAKVSNIFDEQGKIAKFEEELQALILRL